MTNMDDEAVYLLFVRRVCAWCCRCSAKDPRRPFFSLRCSRQRRCFSRFPPRERESGTTPLPPCMGWVQCVLLGGFSFVGQPEFFTPRASSALGLAIEDSLPLLSLPFLGQSNVVDGRVPPSCVVVVRPMAFPPLTKCSPSEERRAGLGRERGASVLSRRGSDPR